jgi:ADP-ribose pyrophosphatase YjhB (NUDIX family)
MKSKRYAGILVKAKDKVLLCKRAEGEDKHDGEWSIPCGTVKKGEEPIDGAYREFYEETNIEITDEIELNALIGFVNKQELKGILYVYLYEVDREFDVNLEDAMDNHEHTECGWFSLDELPEPMGLQLEKIVFRNLR